MTSPRVTLTPTTREDVARFLPDKLPWRIRALTAKRGDDIIGIGGIALLPDGSAAAFLEVSEENAKRYPITLHKAARAILTQARALGLGRLITECDRRRPAAARYLERLGFTFFGVASKDGHEIEVWEWVE